MGVVYVDGVPSHWTTTEHVFTIAVYISLQQTDLEDLESMEANIG